MSTTRERVVTSSGEEAFVESLRCDAPNCTATVPISSDRAAYWIRAYVAVDRPREDGTRFRETVNLSFDTWEHVIEYARTRIGNR